MSLRLSPIVASMLWLGCAAGPAPSGTEGQPDCPYVLTAGEGPRIDGEPVDDELYGAIVGNWLEEFAGWSYCVPPFDLAVVGVRQRTSARVAELGLLRSEGIRQGITSTFDEQVFDAMGGLPGGPGMRAQIEEARLEARIWSLSSQLIPFYDDIDSQEVADRFMAIVPTDETAHVSLRTLVLRNDHPFLDDRARDSLAKEVHDWLARDPETFVSLALGLKGRGIDSVPVRWEIHLGGKQSWKVPSFLVEELEAHFGEQLFSFVRPDATWFVIIDSWETDDLDQRHRDLIGAWWGDLAHWSATYSLIKELLEGKVVEIEEEATLPIPGTGGSSLWFNPDEEPPAPASGDGIGVGYPIYGTPWFSDYLPPSSRR